MVKVIVSVMASVRTTLSLTLPFIAVQTLDAAVTVTFATAKQQLKVFS